MSIFYQRLPLAEKPNKRILTEAVRRRAGIGQSHWDGRLSAIPDDMDYKKVIQGYIVGMHQYERMGLGIALHGDLGTGKTTLGAIILRNALARRAG